MRATLALDQPIVVEYQKYPFLADILPAEIKAEMDRAPRETEVGMRELYDYLIDTWHGRAHGRLAAAVSCSAPQRATVPYLHYLSALAHEKDLPFICHILETKTQRVLGDEVFGRSLVRYAHDLGILDGHMQVIHAIWVDDEDIALLAQSGCTVAHNPVCNLRLGSGVMPFRKLRDAGVPICLGTDEAIADDSHNLWGAAKTATLIHTLADSDDRRWPKAGEMLDVIWRGGACSMRRPETFGVLQEGAAADIALLDLAADSFTPLNDIERQLVFCETGSSVRYTIVAGHVVVDEGRVTTVDETAIKAELKATMPVTTEAMAALRLSAAKLEPYYREMVRRAGTRDVGFTRTLS
jgi:cytosine/adenosine deaminase-related metal-dependent hydrolase